MKWPPVESYYYADEWTCVIHGDCLELLNKLPKVDLLLTDWPYGKIGGSKSIGGSKIVEVNKYDLSWDVRLNENEVNLVLDSADRHILWGGNYYTNILPLTNSWLIWDKKLSNGWEDNFSDGEMAWTDLEIPLRIYRHLWMGVVRKNGSIRKHPTEKPVELFEWCLGFNDGSIVDPFLGSGPSLVAAKQ